MFLHLNAFIFFIIVGKCFSKLSGAFSPLTCAEACEKSSQWFWEEIRVGTGVRKPGNICASTTAMI